MQEVNLFLTQAKLLLNLEQIVLLYHTLSNCIFPHNAIYPYFRTPSHLGTLSVILTVMDSHQMPRPRKNIEVHPSVLLFPSKRSSLINLQLPIRIDKPDPISIPDSIPIADSISIPESMPIADSIPIAGSIPTLGSMAIAKRTKRRNKADKSTVSSNVCLRYILQVDKLFDSIFRSQKSSMKRRQQ